jgi:hypothetical protein
MAQRRTYPSAHMLEAGFDGLNHLYGFSERTSLCIYSHLRELIQNPIPK